MQDRFKFRYNYNNKIYDVFAIDFFHSTGQIVSLDRKETLMCKINLDNLIQCTGLKDKNGKLIYEGDIVSVKVEIQDFFGEDEYYSENYKGKIIFEKGEIAIDVIDITRHLISLFFNIKGCEVIGNIYENPEVIGGAK
jgi:uncharacterized phage protein (TIGR01671 family)